MMVRIFTILLLATGLLLTGDVHAQEKRKEYKKLRSESSGKSSEQLLREADDLKEKNPGEALNKVEEAVGISLVQEDVFNEGKSYLLLGEINESIEEWNLAIENYSRAYQKFSREFAGTPEHLKALSGLGHANLKAGNYEEAMKYIQAALTLPMHSSVRAELQLDLSEIHYQMGNYDEAMKILDGMTSASNKASSPSSRLQNQQAKTYARKNDLEKTKDLYQNSLNTLRSNRNTGPQDEASLQKSKEEIVDVLREQNLYDDEIALRNQSIEYNLEENNMAEVTKDKVEISKTLEAKGETTAAIKEMEAAARIADTLDNPKEQANAYLSLAGLYEKNGRTNQALQAYRKYSQAVVKKDALSEAALSERSTLIKKQKDIEELTKDVSIGQREATIEQATFFRQQLIIYGLSLIILIIGVTSYFIYKNAQASKVANQLLALKSLRSQMNPHFIFNALNSVNHFIAQQDERTANKFLSEFSQLMRLVLENSQEDFIPLQKEQEILSLYLKLEHYRFRDKFDYEIVIDDRINSENIEVPPMLIQPYIENSVWHGLRYKESRGKLMLRFQKEPGHLLVEITDDGIGRTKSAALKTENQKKHNSTGLKNIQERLRIINKVYKANYRVTVEDVNEGGTRVRINLPFNNRTNGR